MKEIVIFDTNIVRNPDLVRFLGGRDILRQLEPDAYFYIPELVSDEIRNQKRIKFYSDRENLLKNPLVKKYSPDLCEIEAIKIDDLIDKIIEEESFSFEIFPCVHGELIDEFRAMALRNAAPFEEKTDKGIKDTCIYFSILKLIKERGLSRVFFFCKDGRLTEAFKDNPAVIVINSIAAFHEVSAAHLVDEYFSDTVSTTLGIPVFQEHFVNSWKSWQGLWILVIEADKSYIIATESREVIDFVEFTDIDELVMGLVNSRSFTTTHSAVSNLEPYIFAISKENKELIKEAAKENTQILWLSEDSDVESFLQKLELK